MLLFEAFRLHQHLVDLQRKQIIPYAITRQHNVTIFNLIKVKLIVYTLLWSTELHLLVGLTMHEVRSHLVGVVEQVLLLHAYYVVTSWVEDTVYRVTDVVRA